MNVGGDEEEDRKFIDESTRAAAAAADSAVTKEQQLPHAFEEIDGAAATPVLDETTVDTTATTSLPEIEFDFADDTFLVDPDQLFAVFDQNENDSSSDSDHDLDLMQSEEDGHPDSRDPSFDENEHNFPIDVDLETEQLYQELAGMSISEKNKNQYADGQEDFFSLDPFAADSIPTGGDGAPFYMFCRPCDDMDEAGGTTMGDDDDGDFEPLDPSLPPITEDPLDPFAADSIPTGSDGAPFYMWCRPCDDMDEAGGTTMEDGDDGDFETLDPSLPPITEDQPLDVIESEIVRKARENHIEDLRALYQSSQRPQHEDEEGIFEVEESDPLVKELEGKAARREEDSRSAEAARQWMAAFGVEERQESESVDGPQSPPNPSKNILKSCLGHKETIFGVDFTVDGRYIATASQDATVNVWDAAKNKLVVCLKGHNTAYECLRVSWAGPTWANNVLDREGRFTNIIASAGADGMVKLWTCKDIASGAQQGQENGWKCEFDLDHASFLGRAVPKTVAEEEEADKPQVYALQFMDDWKVFTKMLKEHRCIHSSSTSATEQADVKMSISVNESVDEDKNSFLMTSSDEFIHLWEVEGHPFDKQLQLEDTKIRLLQDNELKLKEVMSLHFGSLQEPGYGVTPCSVTGRGLKLPPPPEKKQLGPEDNTFGGERNPQNIVYVFDAAYCAASGLLGVALSDGSLRLVNGRGSCVSVLTLPGSKSHLTSFCWDSTGSRLATCVATGHLITWSLDWDNHDGGNQNIVATCTAIMEGGHQTGRPLFGTEYCGKDDALLLSWGVDGTLCLWGSHAQGNVFAPMAILKQDSGHPIYSVSVSERNVAIGGGGSDGGFIGIPLYLANLPDPNKLNEEQQEVKAVQKEDPPVPKKSKTED